MVGRIHLDGRDAPKAPNASGLRERIELTHRASNRDIFARGALHAAVRLVGRPPGQYRVRDLLT